MSYRVIHHLARRQAHRFVELLWDEIPGEDKEHAQFDLELYLALFDIKAKKDGLSGFGLLAAVRKRAETYYQDTFALPHHTAQEWAFFRFRLELAMLRTIGASEEIIGHCYAWHDLTAGFAHRIGHYGQDRPDRSARP